MTVSPGKGSGATGWTRVIVLVLVALFLISAQTEKKSFGQKLKAMFTDTEEKELPPVEEVFTQAEEHFNGKETWYGRMVRKVNGEDSWAYRNLWGVTRINYMRARELYQQVTDNYPFSKYAPMAQLRIADCHYQMEEYEEAAIWYRQFTKFHPRREEVPRALFQEGMSHFNRMLKPPRDQNQTREALVVFEDLVARFPESEYAGQAREKIDECKDRLAKQEFLVADFYFKRKEYWAAAARYQGIWRQYPGLGYDDRAIYMEAECYRELGKIDLAKDRYQLAAENFVDTDYGTRAKDRLNSLENQ